MSDDRREADAPLPHGDARERASRGSQSDRRPSLFQGRCPTCGQKLNGSIGTVGRCQNCRTKLEFTAEGLRVVVAESSKGESAPQPVEGAHGPCPGCGKPVKVLVGAPGPCPHCGLRICFNGKEIVAPKVADVEAAAGDVKPSVAPEEFSLQIDEDRTRSKGSKSERWGIPRRWAIGGALAGLMGIAAVLILFMAEPEPVPVSPDETIAVPDSESVATKPPAPIEIPDIGSGGVFKSPGNSTDEPRSTQPSRPRTAAGGVEEDWAFAVQGGQRLVVDGIELVPAGRFDADWSATLPPGSHLVRAGDDPPQRVTVGKGFPDRYKLRMAEVNSGQGYDFQRLLDRSLSTLGVAVDPVSAHLWGNYYWQEREPDAAIRAWREAIRLDPGFAPAHLNLAFALADRKKNDEASRELELAFHWNHQDAFGIAAHIEELSRKVGFAADAGLSRYDPGNYDELRTGAGLSEKQRQVIRTLETVRAYVVDPGQRIRVVNNMGAYLLHEAQPASAYEYFRRALREIASTRAALDDRLLVKTVLENLGLAAEAAKMAEARFYRELAKTVE